MLSAASRLKIVNQAKEKGMYDTDDLSERLKIMEKLVQQQQQQTTNNIFVKASEANKTGQGLILSGYLLNHGEKKFSKEVEGKVKTYIKHEYKLWLCTDFSKVLVPSEEGVKVNENTIDLLVHASKRMTESEKTEFVAQKKKDKTYNNFTDNTKNKKWIETEPYEIKSGSIITVGFWGTNPFEDDSGQPFRKGDMVMACGISANRSYKEDGRGFMINLDISSMKENNTKEVKKDLLSKCLALSKVNTIPNVGFSGGYGDHNLTEEDKEYEKQQQREYNSKISALVKWKNINRRLPINTRKLLQKMFIRSLSPISKLHEATVEEIYRDEMYIFSRPRWTKDFTYQDEVKEQGQEKSKKILKRQAVVIYDTSVSFVGQQTSEKNSNNIDYKKIKTQIHLDDNLMKDYGIEDAKRFGNVAPHFVTNCDAMIMAKIDLLSSFNMEENSEQVNPIDEDGIPKTGYHYGAIYNAQCLIGTDLVSGLVRGGYHVQTNCVKKAIEVVFASSKREDVKKNVLNTVPGLPIINILESSVDIETLSNNGYQFYFIGGGIELKSSETVQHFLSKMKKKEGKSWKNVLGEVISGTDKRYVGLPIKMSDPESFCIFAVKKNLVDIFKEKEKKLLQEETESEHLERIVNEARDASLNKRAMNMKETETSKMKRRKMEIPSSSDNVDENDDKTDEVEIGSNNDDDDDDDDEKEKNTGEEESNDPLVNDEDLF